MFEDYSPEIQEFIKNIGLYVFTKFNFHNLLIYYPSLRIYYAAKIAGIKKISSYNFLSKKNCKIKYFDPSGKKKELSKIKSVHFCKSISSACLKVNFNDFVIL